MEIYKYIKGYEGLYQISNYGNVKSLPKSDGNGNRERLLKQEVIIYNHTNYRRVTLSKDGITKRFQVHRLVGFYFINNYENKPNINHIDNNGENNHVSNLEWVTHSENMLHAQKQGRLFNAQNKGRETQRKTHDIKTKEKMVKLLGDNFIEIKNVGSRKYVYYTCEICNDITKSRSDSLLLRKGIVCNSCSRTSKFKIKGYKN